MYRRHRLHCVTPGQRAPVQVRRCPPQPARIGGTSAAGHARASDQQQPRAASRRPASRDSFHQSAAATHGIARAGGHRRPAVEGPTFSGGRRLIKNGILDSCSIDESQLRGPQHGKQISDMKDRATIVISVC
ncbi:hypothetical protein WJX75_001176 [Coccomyxa subellipsoidea]|uniref:Uncharacterized protein n=1 Tax=Coccomyxa subellipsoidea TaxID=248742 RepID=A0ABR2YNP5_9CHLO